MVFEESMKTEESREPIRVLRYPSIFDKATKLATIEEVLDWTRELIDYLENGTLLLERKSTIQLRMKVGRFTMVNGTLYKRGFTLPLIKCVLVEEGNYIFREIHERICESHSKARVLAHKAVQASFYWPNMNKDSMVIVQNCEKCQRFANITKQPPEKLSSISSP